MLGPKQAEQYTEKKIYMKRIAKRKEFWQETELPQSALSLANTEMNFNQLHLGFTSFPGHEEIYMLPMHKNVQLYDSYRYDRLKILKEIKW